MQRNKKHLQDIKKFMDLYQKEKKEPNYLLQFRKHMHPILLAH